MSTRDMVSRGLGKKSIGLNFELLDQTDVMEVKREMDDVEQSSKEAREIAALGGGLKLRPGTDVMTSCRLPLVVNTPIRKEVLDTAVTLHRPKLVHAVFAICFLTVIFASIFTLFDSMAIIEVAYRVHALAGLKLQGSQEQGPAVQDGTPQNRVRLKDARLMVENFKKNTALANSDAAARSSSWVTNWFHIPVIPHDIENLSRQIDDKRCRGNSTHGAHVFGLPTPDKGVIRLTTGFIHNIRLVSFDSYGQRRCAGGDYYETSLTSTYWKSRPPVLDLDNGSYELDLQVDPQFAGFYTFKVVLLFSNFDGLKQLDPTISDQDFKKYFHDKVLLNLDVDFVLPPMLAASQPRSHQSALQEVFTSKAAKYNLPQTEGLSICKASDFNLKQWSGRWTQGVFNPKCSIDSADKARFKCLDPDTKCEHPWCEGAVGRLESNGWVYSAHCSFRIFSPDEAWKCLDGKWLFWWTDSTPNDQEIPEDTLVSILLNSVLGLSLSPWDSNRRPLSTKVFTRNGMKLGKGRPFRNVFGQKTQYYGPGKRQQVRVTSMNADHVGLKEQSQILFNSYFTDLPSPDIIVMNPGFRDAKYWPNWTEFVNVGLGNATSFWKGPLDRSILPWNRHPRIIYTTSGAKRLSEFNPQLMEMYTRFLLDAHIKANLTSDFRIVDGFDYSFSWMGRYAGNQRFVDLMFVHMLLTAMCVD